MRRTTCTRYTSHIWEQMTTMKDMASDTVSSALSCVELVSSVIACSASCQLDSPPLSISHSDSPSLKNSISSATLTRRHDIITATNT